MLSVTAESPLLKGVSRHPFPGPSLAIRIIGEVTEEKLAVLREADDIFIRGLRAYDCTGMGFPSRTTSSARFPTRLSARSAA